VTTTTGKLGGPVTDDELVRLFKSNPGWKFERDDHGELVVSPTSTSGGARTGAAYQQLCAYAKQAGGQASDTSIGFRTPRGGVVCPEASWISAERLARHRSDKSLWPMMPDVAIEIASYTTDWPKLKKKIDRYVEHGAGYALAVDPRSHRTYERGQRPEGLALDLAAMWDV